VLTENELNPQHHIFPQEERPWFTDRGIDVDQYTVRVPVADHQAFHAGGGPSTGGGWWNDMIMGQLGNQDAGLGRLLLPEEIQAVGNQMLQRFNLLGRPIVPFEG
jgi:Predicted lipoprotein of unknown function (DUF2380)